MIELYHSLHSTCSQKVRLCLEEKGIAWTGHHLNLRQFDQLRPEFLKLNPQALVPVLVDAGRVLTESRIINEYLEEQYPETPLMPASAYERAQVRAWSQYIDSVPAEAVKLPSFVKNIQPELLRMGLDKALPMIEKIPNPHIQARWRLAATHGIAAQDLAPSHIQLKAMVERLDQALQSHTWLCGDALTLADLEIAPFVQRLVRIDLFHWVEQRPRVWAWFNQLRSRSAYKRAMPEPGSEGTLPP